MTHLQYKKSINLIRNRINEMIAIINHFDSCESEYSSSEQRDIIFHDITMDLANDVVSLTKILEECD